MTKKPLAVHSDAAKPYNAAETRLTMALSRQYRASLIHTAMPTAPVDAIWVQDGVCVGCSEHKCRNITREEIRTLGDTYLITEQKLFDGIDASTKLGVPFYVAALFIPEETVYLWQVTDTHGVPQFQWDAALTTTQDTCEGGTATRLNAYLPMHEAKTIFVNSIRNYLRKMD